jgi:hypothetical protein
MLNHEPFEHEEYNNNSDRLILVGTLVVVALCIAAILYTPDIEAIGAYVYNLWK